MKNLLRVKLISLFFPLSISWLTAQTISLQKRFGTNTMDRVYHSMKTLDKGYLLMGAVYNNNDGFGDDDILLVKLDSLLDQEWTFIYGGEDNDSPYDIIEEEGSFLLVGSTQSAKIESSKNDDVDFPTVSKGNLDCLLLRIAKDGRLLDVKTYGGPQTDYATRVLKHSNNDYIIGAVSNSNIGGDKGHRSKGSFDYWIYKLREDYTIEWQKTIGGTNDDRLDVFQYTNEGNILAGGSSVSKDGADKTVGKIGYRDIWLMELDTNANIIWQNAFGSRFNDLQGEYYESNVSRYAYVPGSASLDTNYFYLVGSSQNRLCGSKQYDFSVFQIHNTGMLRKTIQPYANKDDAASSIVKCADDGWLIAGTSRSDKGGDKSEENRGGHDIWIMKLDKNFKKVWDKTFGGTTTDYGPRLHKWSHNEHLVILTCQSGLTGDINVPSLGPSSDILLIKIKDHTIPD